MDSFASSLLSLLGLAVSNLDIKDTVTPSLMDSPFTTSNLPSPYPCIGAISHISRPSYPFPVTSVSEYLPSQLPRATRQHHLWAGHGLHRFPVSPSFPRMSKMFPSVPTHIIPPSARSSFQTHHTRVRTLNSPAFLLPDRVYARTWTWNAPSTSRCLPHKHSSHAAHRSPDSRHATALRSRSHSSWRTSWLPVRARVSKRFSTAALLAFYRALELSADDTRAARLASHGPSSILALAAALRSIALSSLTLPAFDAELLAAAPGTLTHLALPRRAPCSA
ncbi:hypothetical protein EDB86DRAFT_3157336 [Lactarius hatsudake]|nr:hypothetical protein EDB86DRAFT_3157336 [Lactarius hatsudake]